MAKLASNFNCTTLANYTKITGLQETFKTGNKLSFSNDEIVIGKGISTILINAKLTWYAATGGIKYAFVKKNSENLAWSTISVQSNTYISETISGLPVNVKEGDKISMVYYTDTSGDSLCHNGRTYLTVEVVE